MDPTNLSAVDEINNLDTARLSLRWALERLNSLQKEILDQAAHLARETELRRKAEEDVGKFERLERLRPAEASSRLAFDAELERFALLALAGKLDVAPLAARELELKKIEKSLETARIEAEKLLAERRQELESEFKDSSQAVQKHKEWIAQTSEDISLRLKKLESRADEIKKDEQDFSREKLALHGLAAEWDEKNRAQFLKILELEKSVRMVEQRAEQAEQSLSLAARARDEQAQRLAIVQNDLDRARVDLEKKGAEFDLRTHENREARRRLAAEQLEVKRSAESQAAALTQSLRASEDDAQQLRAAVENAQKNAAAQAAYVVELEQRLLRAEDAGRRSAAETARQAGLWKDLHDRQQAAALRSDEIQKGSRQERLLEKKNQELTSQIAQLKSVISEFSAQNDDLRKASQHEKLLESQNRELSSQIAQLKGAIIGVSAKNEKLQNQLADAVNAAGQAAHALADLSEKEALEQGTAQEDLRHFEAEKAAWLAEKDLMQKEIAARHEGIATRHQEITAAAAAQESLARRLAQAEKTIADAAAKDQLNLELRRQLDQANEKFAQVSAALAAEVERRKKLEKFIAARLGGHAAS